MVSFILFLSYEETLVPEFQVTSLGSPRDIMGDPGFDTRSVRLRASARDPDKVTNPVIIPQVLRNPYL